MHRATNYDIHLGSCTTIRICNCYNLLRLVIVMFYRLDIVTVQVTRHSPSSYFINIIGN